VLGLVVVVAMTAAVEDRGFQLDAFVPGDPDTRGLSIVRARDVIYVAGSRPNGENDSFGRVVTYNGAGPTRDGRTPGPARRAALDAATAVASHPGLTLPAGDVVRGLVSEGTLVYFVGSEVAPTIGVASLAAGSVTKWTVDPGQPALQPTARVASFDGLVYSGPEVVR
jgi:hypothetical protein